MECDNHEEQQQRGTSNGENGGTSAGQQDFCGVPSTEPNVPLLLQKSPTLPAHGERGKIHTSATTALQFSRRSPGAFVTTATTSSSSASSSSFSSENCPVQSPSAMTGDPSLKAANKTAVAALVAAAPETILSYAIDSFSSYSGTYHPRYIMENKPADQSSRWSSAVHDPSQYITLKLDRPAVARSITFGKFYRAHVCNLREFKVYGGMHPEDMTELLHHGLRNNTEPETFPLLYMHHNLIFPVRYIKIVPLSTFAPNFNFSIWHVCLKGIQDSPPMHRVMTEYQNFMETETLRLCLKHFRQRNMMDIFYLIKHRTNVELEHPFLTNLHESLVMKGDYSQAESLVQHAYKENMFNTYSQQAPYTALWKRIYSTTEDSPCARGGHQMCIDTQSQTIYLLGGWDGYKDLGDFWRFHIPEGRWELISHNTESEGGPGPRSCHKICYDPGTRCIYVLGRYVDPHNEAADRRSDFYRYSINAQKWERLSKNTVDEGGPCLLFDHQMCIDSNAMQLFVFGGRAAFTDPNVHLYGGLYMYDIRFARWSLIREDGGKASLCRTAHNTDGALEEGADGLRLRARVGHSMLFDPKSRDLYIFAGQRLKDYLTDLHRYNVDTDVLEEITQEFTTRTTSDAGFTQRASIDCDRKEIHVFSGYMRHPGSDIVKNSLWVYDIAARQWTTVYENGKQDQDYWARMAESEPRPRYAHEMLYDRSTRTHYLFGGNPGGAEDGGHLRLDDFWALHLQKPEPADIYRRCVYLLRMQRLRELCREADACRSADSVPKETMTAVTYLQQQVAPIIDHNNQEESSQFRQMCAHVCLASSFEECPVRMDEEEGGLVRASEPEDRQSYQERTHLFENILKYLPQEMKEPSGHLMDAVKMP